MFLNFLSSKQKPRRTRTRTRTLRLESLDKRELMDASGMGPQLPVMGPVQPAEISFEQAFANVSSRSSQNSHSERINRGDVKSSLLPIAGQTTEYSWRVSGREAFQLTIAPQNGMIVQYDLYAPGHSRPMPGYSGLTGSEKILRVIYTGGNPGDMTLRVTTTRTTPVGRVLVGLESVSNPSDDATTIRRGRVVTGTLREPIAVNQHVFTSNQRETVQIAITPIGNQPLRYQIFGPGSAGPVNGDFHDGSKPFGHRHGITRTPIVLTMPTAGQSGKWIIQIQSNNFSRNVSYKVGLETVTAPSPNATAVQRGFSQTSTISESLQANQFKLNSRARENYRIDITPVAGMRVSYQVFAPGFDNPIHGLSGTTDKPIRLNLGTVHSGDFVILVRAADNLSTGSFKLAVR